MEEEVGKGTGALLVGCVGWLEDEGGLNGEEKAGGVEELQRLVSDGETREKVQLTGCAEKKINFCERMAPQMIAASCIISVRFDLKSVPVKRTHDPDASLRNSCSAYGMSVVKLEIDY